MRITLPYPPSINNYYAQFNGNRIISKRGREYRQLVVSLMREHGGEPQQGRLKVRIGMHPPDTRRRDVDNVLKSLLDSLQHGGAYQDDSQIFSLSIEKLEPIRHGYVTVEVTPYEQS